MTAALVRFAEVRWTDDDGLLVYARRGETVELPAAEYARLVALGAVVPPGVEIAPTEDPRPWAEVIQEAADRRYDWAPK